MLADFPRTKKIPRSRMYTPRYAHVSVRIRESEILGTKNFVGTKFSIKSYYQSVKENIRIKVKFCFIMYFTLHTLPYYCHVN